jgi:dGTPase
LREFAYERVYTRPASVAQAAAVVDVLRALVEHYATFPIAASDDPVRAAVAYVGGMTDRFAFAKAVQVLGWDPARIPVGIS